MYVRIDGRLASFGTASDLTYWDAIGQAPTEEALGKALRSTARLGPHGRFFRKWLPREGRILEAGCGNGLWVSRLRENGYDCLGIDLSIPTLLRSRKHRGDLPLVGGDVTRLPFNDASLSGYVSFGVVEHFRDGPQSVLREAKRVLKSGGILCVSVPYENYLRRRLESRTEEEARSLGLDFSFYYFTFSDLNDELSRAGFTPPVAFHGYYVNLGLRAWFNGRQRILRTALESKAGLLFDLVPLLPYLGAHMMFTVAVRE
jgi:SAM-dependent methyltransferase